MCLAADAVLNKCFHRRALSTHRTLKIRRGCANLQKFSNGGPGLPAQASKGRQLCHHGSMSQQPQPPKIQMNNTPEYRENYANSVQIRVNLWDFLLLFGLVNQTSPDSVTIQNFQGIFLSPQQAKALLNVLQQNVTQYETAFGEIKLEPHQVGGTVQ
jgi:flagellar protein FlaG